jgi:hypothetical protein
MFRVGWIGHDREEVLVAADPTHIFRRSCARTSHAGGKLEVSVAGDELLELDCMKPTVAKIIEVGKGAAVLGTEIPQPHFVFGKDAGVVFKAAVFQEFGIAVPKAAYTEFMQVVVPPIESRLDCKMELVQAPSGWHDKSSPDRGLYLGQRDTDLNGGRLFGAHSSE